MCMLLYFQITAFCIIAVSATCLLRSGLDCSCQLGVLHRRLYGLGIFCCTLFWLSYVLLIYIITCQSVITFHIDNLFCNFSNSVYFLPSSVCALMCLDLLQFGCRRSVAHSVWRGRTFAHPTTAGSVIQNC